MFLFLSLLLSLLLSLCLPLSFPLFYASNNLSQSDNLSAIASCARIKFVKYVIINISCKPPSYYIFCKINPTCNISADFRRKRCANFKGCQLMNELPTIYREHNKKPKRFQSTAQYKFYRCRRYFILSLPSLLYHQCLFQLRFWVCFSQTWNRLTVSISICNDRTTI